MIKNYNINNEPINLIYFMDKSNNWGDYASPIIISLLTGRKIQHYHVKDIIRGNSYAVMGSIMELLINSNTTIWGTGFMFLHGRLKIVPKQICAVRGPLTRNIVLKHGINCPAIYGDPSLLFPRVYDKYVSKKYTLGIVPHYADKNNPWLQSITDKNIKIIDICSETFKFIDEIRECEYIISSSLHGIVISDAYGIPNRWVKLSDKICGGTFKFIDYMMSINRNDRNPFLITDKTTIKEILEYDYTYKTSIDLDLFYRANPFNI